LYEDVIEYSNLALAIDANHQKSQIIQAKAQAFLLNFNEGFKVFK